MLSLPLAYGLILAVFVVGYLGIIFEYAVKINKTASALAMAVLTWMFFFLTSGDTQLLTHHLGEHLQEVVQIILFLLGAMTLVELIDSHKGFRVITDLIHVKSKRSMLWVVALITFFLSAILDNLTTAIVMVSLLRKLIPEPKERIVLGAMVVIAANAGGAWTPIGDVTTTMLWINGNITSWQVMKSLFLPSAVALAVSLLFLQRGMKGNFIQEGLKREQEKIEPNAKLVFYTGLGALIAVPIFKAATGLPPFMGILMGLSVLWILTDYLHHGSAERQHLRVPHVLTRIDTSGVLFFLGILLAVACLDEIGALQSMSHALDVTFKDMRLIAVIIGLISAVIDNVPLVAAGMSMYSVATYPVDSLFWQLLAYCAGTGGSILVIGSAAGVALMGMEKVDFVTYFKKASLAAFVGYLAGVAVLLVL